MMRLAVGIILSALGVWLIAMPLPTTMSGLCLIGFGLLFVLNWVAEKRKWKKGIRWATWIVGVSVFSVLAVSIIAICFGGHSQWEKARQGDYAVVLGAQIWGDRPSLILEQRLDVTLRFLNETEDTIVIVSGGQGSDEIVTEASVMRAYLLERGADPARIFVEEDASNTRENLQNSMRIAEREGCDAAKPVLITSEFHMARAKYIAGSLDLEPVGISSWTKPFQVKVNSLVREVFAFAKAWFIIQF